MARTIVDELTGGAIVALVQLREREALALAVRQCEEERRAWQPGDGTYAADGCIRRIRALMVKM